MQYWYQCITLGHTHIQQRMQVWNCCVFWFDKVLEAKNKNTGFLVISRKTVKWKKKECTYSNCSFPFHPPANYWAAFKSLLQNKLTTIQSIATTKLVFGIGIFVERDRFFMDWQTQKDGLSALFVQSGSSYLVVACSWARGAGSLSWEEQIVVQMSDLHGRVLGWRQHACAKSDC